MAQSEGGFADISFDDFRRMASDESLSQYEKIGFPDSYREAAEGAIFEDLVAKLPALSERSKTVLDIGPGCSELPRMIRALCEQREHLLLLVDSPEMLDHHPDRVGARKFAARFPDCEPLLEEFAGAVDVIIAYSVLHYVLPDASVFTFIDRCLELLAPGGMALIGDVPNASKRRRFFASAAGQRFHRDFTGSESPPEPAVNQIETNRIDDSVVLALLARARAAGFDACVVPQRADLPMANRREDLLFIRP